MHDLEALLWPVSRLGEALEALVRTSGLSARALEVPNPPPHLTQVGEVMGQWLESAAGGLGVDTEPVQVPYTAVAQFLGQAGPALLCLPGAGTPRLLVLCAGGQRLTVLSLCHTVHRLKPEAVRHLLCQALETPYLESIEAVLDAARVPVQRRALARAAMLRQQLGEACLRDCWLLRLPAGVRLWPLIRQAHLPQRFLTLLGAYTGQYVVWLLAWWLIGRTALQGRLDVAWLLTWALLLLTLVPCRLSATWLQGLVAIGIGGLSNGC